MRREGLFGDSYTDIPQPADRGILLKDILEDSVDEKYFLSDEVVNRIIGRNRFDDNKFKFGADKGSPVLSSGGGNNSDMDLICVAENSGANNPVCLNKQRNDYGRQIRKAYENHTLKARRKEIRDYMPRNDGKTGVVNTCQADNLLYIPEDTKKGYIEIHKGEAFDMTQPNSTTRRGRKMDSKCNCLTTQSGDSYFIFEGIENGHLQKNLTDVEGKANSFLATSGKGAWANGMTIIRVDGDKSNSQPNRIYSDNGKSPNIGGAHFSNTVNVTNGYRILRITPTECARLQTIPEWYRWECSETQQYRMLGNGWTVEVIKHIFSFMEIK